MTSNAPPSTSSQGERPRRPLYHNVISGLGLLVVLLAALLIFAILLIELLGKTPHPYIGMFVFLVLPGIAGMGVLQFLIGMRIEAGRRKRNAKLSELPYPSVDLNDPRQRKLFVVVVVAGAFSATLLSWAGYEGYEYTESVSFCGQTCHTPMNPEYTAYLDSAHARVRCVECHVGSGATHYIKSKVQGAHQLIAVVTGEYARPIATPIKNLRPARETCEKCHWPEKFFGAKLLQLPHYRYDDNNTAEQVTLVLKTGGGSKAHGESGGVHWHMMIDNQVTFAASDAKLQDIPWVKVKHRGGGEKIYVSRRTRLTASDIEKLPRHQMDCMDCHNRPAHGFPSPDGGIDQALFKGQISATLPRVKRLLVEVMMEDYPDSESAHRAIATRLNEHYKTNFPDVARERTKDIDQAIRVASQIYDRAVFPEMRVNWQTYPTNIGHRNWPGCFRCHDGQHVAADGAVLANDCATTCHTQPRRSAPTSLGVVDPNANADWHPWQLPSKSIDIPAHQALLCSNCHRAGRGPISGCDGCHKKQD